MTYDGLFIQPVDTGFPNYSSVSDSGFTDSYFISSEAINDLNSNKYSLKNGVFFFINVSEEDDCYRAEYDDLDLWATGKNRQDVLVKIKKEIVLLYKELEEIGEDKLGPIPLNWWKILKDSIIKHEET
ncbi:hypothetical protein A3A46_02235 [Candidatus Roizmanbacteria bacterium RIFCSPLOWO2_01_FULL_37_13]|uniref:Uncharacterized protein n=1 Tax=Candidatus Roizmanbacteria bacterium RIFCSPHIGHO2_02_FULL_38_11 TaxID=1802039 RepID=A0A1F7H2N1_9BACT|nr:MAG: hypothetical protein A3C25_03630 [Candidatus Roizmanbacteria bacterium RIFCSPHIGHO2_02_FULL_38_11]OGK34808.1 MAG: hypothetical protein A3F58_00655 [Candidatus Roizmanbacteria bacterium RIFCSPHIGHO2_12_FULL_37_9b]OGK41397.1 MAG: hypothetical protein A3A46_02235 [Candidatus Roizmanbacteria bacterium RIFCSPLOWO2_01_FULL_37_13]